VDNFLGNLEQLVESPRRERFGARGAELLKALINGVCLFLSFG